MLPYEPDTLAINLCTRGRPGRMLECVRRTLPNISLNSTKLIISVDSDDSASLEALPFLPRDDRIIPWVKPREDDIGSKWNRVLEFPSSVYTYSADYCAYATPGFDRLILDAASLFPDKIGVVVNHMANASFAGIYALTHELTAKLGYFFPPYFPYWFVDHWIDDIAKLIDRISFADVHLDIAQKLPTQEMRDLAFWSTLFDALKIVRRQDARRIIDDPEFREPEWRKEILRRGYPRIEFYSQWINEGMRANPALTSVGNSTDGGDRYRRLKTRALALLADLEPKLISELQKAA